MAVYENSRYLHTTQMTRLGWNVPILDVRKRYTFNENNYIYYTWVEGDTLDGLAYKMYGEPALRWAILDANPRYSSEFDIMCGDSIAIPSDSEVIDKVNV